jgi:FkbM family methyltransferase
MISFVREARARVGGWGLSVLHTVLARDPFPGRGVLERVVTRLVRGTIPVRVRPGYWISLDLKDEYERGVFIGAYEEPLLRFVRAVVHPGDLFVDGGTNIGVHMLNAAVSVGREGRVLAFEPDEDAFARAGSNLALNPSFHARVSLQRTALGDRAGTVGFAQGGDRHLESRVVPTGPQVPCTTLDLQLAQDELQRDRVVVCKLDVEGYEHKVLDGATRLLGRPDTIFICELNDPLLKANGSSADELIARMRAAGYMSWTDAGAPLIAHDPTWVPWLNGVFAKGPRAEARVKATFSEASRNA